MKEYELSKYDFEVLDKALKIFIEDDYYTAFDADKVARVDQLKDKFAKAHSAILFIEED